MQKKDIKKYNDSLLCYAILIFAIGLVGGTGLITIGIKCNSLNAIAYCIFGATVMLTFSVLAFVMYLVVQKEEIKKNLNDKKI